MLEAGSVRAKNVNSILVKNIVDAALSSIIFFVLGFGIAFGDSAGGVVGTSGFMSGGNDVAFWVFQMAFAATAATIVSGAIAERTRFLAYFAFSALVAGVVYPTVVHWVWGGGWLSSENSSPGRLIDFAGSGVVHMVGGVGGLVGAWIVGPRVAYIPMSSETRRFTVTTALKELFFRTRPSKFEGSGRKQRRFVHKQSFNAADGLLYWFPETEGSAVLSLRELIDTQAGTDTEDSLVQWELFIQNSYGALAPRIVKVISLVLNTGRALVDVPDGSLVDGQMTVEVVLDRFYEIEMEEKNMPQAPGVAEHVVHRVNELHFEGSSTTNATLGVLILWFGWLGFNAGSGRVDRSGGSVVAQAAMNTVLAPSAATLSSLLVMRLYTRAVDLSRCLNALLAGLVAVTASCAVVTPAVALFIGCTAGPLYLLASHAMRNWLRVDDPVDAAAVHFVNGFWGLICSSFSSSELLQDAGYAAVDGQLWIQLIGAASIMVWTAAWACLVFGSMHYFDLLRVSQVKESRGFDDEFSLEHRMKVLAAREATRHRATKGAESVVSGAAAANAMIRQLEGSEIASPGELRTRQDAAQLSVQTENRLQAQKRRDTNSQSTGEPSRTAAQTPSRPRSHSCATVEAKMRRHDRHAGAESSSLKSDELKWVDAPAATGRHDREADRASSGGSRARTPASGKLRDVKDNASVISVDLERSRDALVSIRARQVAGSE